MLPYIVQSDLARKVQRIFRHRPRVQISGLKQLLLPSSHRIVVHLRMKATRCLVHDKVALIYEILVHFFEVWRFFLRSTLDLDHFWGVLYIAIQLLGQTGECLGAFIEVVLVLFD